MFYTEPTILTESKAANLIMGQINKVVDKSDSPNAGLTDPSAYEADE
jgi:hypothetical protein